MSETELEMMLRNIPDGEAIVARHTVLVARLAQHGEPCETAMLLLHEFKATQASHLAHLERYRRWYTPH